MLEPQAEALAGALGLAPAGGSDRLLVSAAARALITAVAEERPLLCVVDDMHWLDRPSTAAQDLEALFGELAKADVLHPVSRDGVRETDFGTREFATLDADGNLVEFFGWMR
jgi:D-serine deaminase-like pyridoxal phosphate-dependent protein